MAMDPNEVSVRNDILEFMEDLRYKLKNRPGDSFITISRKNAQIALAMCHFIVSEDANEEADNS